MRTTIGFRRAFLAFTTLVIGNRYGMAFAAQDMEIYSNACYNVEGDDTIGERLFIIRLDKVYVLYQEAKGEGFDAPELASADLNGHDITFTVKGIRGTPAQFKGKVTPQEIVGSFSDGRATMVKLGEKFRFFRRSTTDYENCR